MTSFKVAKDSVKDTLQVRTLLVTPFNTVIISCFNDSDDPGVTLPTSFNWLNLLTTEFATNRYYLSGLLHGTCLDYGLNDAAYGINHGGNPNPWAGNLATLVAAGVSLYICEKCLTDNGYDNSQLLPNITPVPFSVQYLIDQQLTRSSMVIYDA